MKPSFLNCTAPFFLIKCLTIAMIGTKPKASPWDAPFGVAVIAFLVIYGIVHIHRYLEKRREEARLEKRRSEEATAAARHAEWIKQNTPILLNKSAVLVPIRQGSKEWLDGRMKGIGASDMPAILGESPWGTPYSVWQLKTGQITEGPPTWPMRRGIKLEPIAREAYIKQTGVKIVPCTIQSTQFSWMRASLDGLSLDGKIVVEIKAPGKVDHAIAMDGKIPNKYIAQCDYLLAVSGAEILHYWSFNGQSGVLVEFHPNRSRIDRSLSIAGQFWEYVTRRKPPPNNFGKRTRTKK